MLKIITSFVLFLFSTQGLSLTAAQNLQALLSPIKTLQANFKQTTTAKSAEFILTATGQVKVVRPGKFYWQVNKPGKQVIVINKGVLWLYDVDLQQVTIKKISSNTLALNPASLLSGDLSALLKNSVVEQTSSSFTLTPKTSNDSTQWIKIVFSSNTLRRVQYENRMGQLTTIEFSDLSINKLISDNIFSFRAPKGTDIVN
jgi:outer membrane lipoprotein carrier protein